MARGQYRRKARGHRPGFEPLGLTALSLGLGLSAAVPAAAQVGAPTTPGPYGLTPGAFTTAPGAYGAPPAIPPVVEPAPAAAAPVEIPSVPPAWLVTPALTLGETFTDNANLAPAGARVWDVITSVTPEIDVTGQTGRLSLGLTYDPQELIFARSSPNAVTQQRLLGTGTAVLWPELLFFDASASITQAYARPTGPIGPTTLTTSNNLTTVYTTNASPYLHEHLGAVSDGESRYRFSTASTDAAGVAPEQIHEVRQTFTNGEDFGRLGWQLTGDYTRLSRLNDPTDPLSGLTSKDELGRADLSYPLYYSFSIIGGVGYERIVDPTLTAPPKGIIWDTGLSYQPNQLVAAKLTYGERFNTTDIEFNGTYNLDPELRLSAIYTETVQTSLSQFAGVTNQAALGVNPDGTISIVSPGTPGTIPISTTASGISSGSFLAKTAELDAVLTKTRDTYHTRFYETKESGNSTAAIASTTTIAAAAATFGGTTSASTVTAERVLGGDFTWDHRLWPELTATADATYFRTLFEDGSGRRDNTYQVSLTLTYTLSRTATANINLLRSDRRSNIAADSLVVDTVMATIRKQF